MIGSPLQIHGFEVQKLNYDGLKAATSIDSILASHEVRASIGFNINASTLPIVDVEKLGRLVFQVGWRLHFRFDEENISYLETQFYCVFSFPLQLWTEASEETCRDILANAVMLALSTGRGGIIVLTGVGASGIVIPTMNLVDSINDYLNENGPFKEKLLKPPVEEDSE